MRTILPTALAVALLTASSAHADERLFFAAETGDVSAVERMVKDGADPDYADANGWTALIFAAFAGRADVVQFLLDHGASATTETKDGVTPLLAATSSGDLPSVEALVRAGADPRRRIAGGMSALDVALATGASSIAQFLQQSDRGAVPVPATASAPGGGGKTTAPADPEAAEQALALTAEVRRQIQEALNAKGFDVGVADGVFGRKTRSGIEDFQKSQGLPVTGYVDQPTFVRLTN